jgi:hypothetical protein
MEESFINRKKFISIPHESKILPPYKIINRYVDVHDFPDTQILNEIKVKHLSHYPLPIMIPSLEVKENRLKICNQTLKESPYKDRDYLNKKDDYYKIKCK